MKTILNPRYREQADFIEALTRPGFFSENGITLHDGRNTIKSFSTSNGPIAVKRYGHLSLFNRLIYGKLRPSKAERAYRHAIRLRRLGIDSPEEVAVVEIRRYGLLEDSYFVAVQSDYKPLRSVTELDTQCPEVAAILDALSEFFFEMHEIGVLHKDLNIGNILYKETANGKYVFQVIDTNRMQFYHRLSRRKRLDNLRRLSCPTPAYLYILDRYARQINANADSVQLEGAIMRFVFEMLQRLKRGLKSTMRNRKHWETRR